MEWKLIERLAAELEDEAAAQEGDAHEQDIDDHVKRRGVRGEGPTDAADRRRFSGDGALVARHRVDDMGLRSTGWHGRVSFINSIGRAVSESREYSIQRPGKCCTARRKHIR